MSEIIFEAKIDILEQMPRPIPTPNQLRELHPFRNGVELEVQANRRAIADIMRGQDDRLLIIAGPCSTDGARLDSGELAAVAYSQAMHEVFTDNALRDRFVFVERCNPAKPRTDIGPRGLEEQDLTLAHQILTEIVNLGNPLTFEIMNDKQLARYGDMLSMAWVGARDVKSTDLRHAVSAYPHIPFFFKNDDYGNMEPAIGAQETVRHPRLVELHDRDNQLVHEDAPGHNTTGLIFRGGGQVNSPESFASTLDGLLQWQRLLVDCSHANGAAFSDGKKSAGGQQACAFVVADMIKHGARPLGIMLESYLHEGKGNLPGQSKTDPCISLGQTIDIIEHLARIVSPTRKGIV